MNNKLRLKLMQETARGNFKLVNSIIISEVLQLDDNTATKIIIECCRIFYKKDPPAVEETDLFHLLLTCQQFIKKFSDDDLFLRYLQSLFFIVQYCLKQKNYEIVFGIKNLILPQFVNCWKDTKLVKAYTNLCNLIHNAIDAKNNGQVYCQLCSLSLEMKSLLSPTNIVLANTAYFYFNSPILLKTEIDLQCNTYLAVLQLFKAPENSYSDDVYSAIVKVTDIVIRNLFKQQEFNKIREYIEVTNLIVEKLTSNQIYHKLFAILYYSSRVVVKLEDIQGGSELLTNNLEKCLKELKDFSNNYILSAEYKKLFDLLHLIFFNLLKYYVNVSSTIWNTFMAEHTQIVICNLLGSTGKILSQFKGECLSCSNCKVKNNLYSALTITSLAGDLFKLSLNKEESVSQDMCCYVFRYLEYCCTIIKKLHSQECFQWKTAWSQVGISIYNIAVKLYSSKSGECCNYFVLLIKNLTQLEGVDKLSIFKVDILGMSLRCLSEISISSYQFKRALIYAALGVLVSSDSANAYNVWIKAKCKSKESSINEDCYLQQLTIVCVLQQYEDEIKELYPDLKHKLDAEVTRSLLMGELAHYKTVWRSKIPMLAAFKKLCDVTDLPTQVKVIIETWEENIYFAHDDVLKLLNEIIFKFKLEVEKKNKDSIQKTEEHLYLALLYTMQYKAQFKIDRKKIADDINSKIIPEQLLPPADEMGKNPNDVCDLVTSYQSLRLDEHLKIMKLLNKALTLFNACISDCTSPNIIESLKQQNVFNVIVKIAHEFRLHRDSLQAIQAWFLCLKIAKLMNNSLQILCSISFLLEETNMDSKIISEFLIEAEILENDMTRLASPEIWTVLTTYHINKSIMLLRHQKIQTGYKEYERARECYLKVEKDKDELLEIRLDFLHTRYLQLPCDLQIEGHNDFSLAKCSKLINRITNYFKVSVNSSFTMAVLFEVYEAVAHMYRWKYLPREVRCYCRDIVTYAQELAIPFQTAYFLIYLAHADLLSTRIDDCQIKLNGLSDLLCLDNKRDNPLTSEPSDSVTVIEKDIDVSSLVDNFSEIMLDCPTIKYQGSSSSPVLFIKLFTQPSFLKHPVDCDCFYCVSVEYKILIMEYINLEAQLQIVRGNTSAAQACYCSGLELYRSIKKFYSSNTTIAKYLACYPLRDWKNILHQTLCALLLNYANSLLKTNDIKKAELFNQKLLNLVSKTKYQNVFVYNEALLQKYTIVINLCKGNCANVPKLLDLDTALSSSKDVNEILKTPENKQTKVVITPCYSPRPNSPPKRRLRKIKCDLLDKLEKNHVETDKPLFSVSDSSKKSDISSIKFDPLQIICKTPASTCSTYVPSTIKTIKKYKPVLQNVHTPLPNSAQLNSENGNSSVEESSIVPPSPNAYTPNALQAPSVLHSRTELLTKKLKKSRKNDLINNHNNTHKEDNASSICNLKSKNVKENICKNLMSELCATETNLTRKRVYKKRTKNISGASNEHTDTIHTPRVTRESKIVSNK